MVVTALSSAAMSSTTPQESRGSIVRLQCERSSCMCVNNCTCTVPVCHCIATALSVSTALYTPEVLCSYNISRSCHGDLTAMPLRFHVIACHHTHYCVLFLAFYNSINVLKAQWEHPVHAEKGEASHDRRQLPTRSP